MPERKPALLVVDDELIIRTTLSLVLMELGYCVRTAEDGISALSEIQKEVPDLLVSDLNMPGMSGFELLLSVRRMFPAILTIAMSGAFQGNEVPSGVAADAFYQKGSSLASLLKILGSVHQTDRMFPGRHLNAAEPVRVQTNHQDESRQPSQLNY
jgi:CheY-like chemotaxis protein